MVIDGVNQERFTRARLLLKNRVVLYMHPVMARKRDPRLKRAGVKGYNKPKRTPGHPKKSG